MPKGGFGNLIALPLQKHPREQGHSLFVDENYNAFPDQGRSRFDSGNDHNRTRRRHSRASGGRHPLDVAFSVEDDNSKPWQRPAPASTRLSGPLPESLKLVQANQIFIAKADLPQPLANRLTRLAAFQNPEFYKAQAMRLPVWNKPRIIGCAENFPQQTACLGVALIPAELMRQNDIHADVRDERLSGHNVTVKFTGVLRKDQKAAMQAMLKHEIGVLCAPTAFGKTVTAAALIALLK